jgi:hypothetical protein
MKTKIKDRAYCGVDPENILSANPTLHEENFKHLSDWIKERYLIHYRKDVEKKNSPWTDNKVLKDYRFTNVKRYQDRESIALINTITSSELSLEDKLLNCILFRVWNKSKTLELLEWPFKVDEFKNEKKFIALVEKSRRIVKGYDKNYVWFTPAFNTGGIKSAWFSPATNTYIGATVSSLRVRWALTGVEQETSYRTFRDAVKEYSTKDMEILEFIDCPEINSYTLWEKDIAIRPFWLGKWAVDNGIIKQILDSKTQEDVFNILKKIPGLAGFLAYQIFVDFAYIEEFPFSENEFTIAGPGCMRGLDLVFEDRDGMNYEEALFWLRDNQHLFGIDFNDLMKDLPEEDRHLTIIDIENSMCEIQKYIKAMNGSGRPRVKYKNQSSFNLF